MINLENVELSESGRDFINQLNKILENKSKEEQISIIKRVLIFLGGC